MKVFVTGATGFVGQEIVRQLNAEGHSLRLLVRNPGSTKARATLSIPGADLWRGDVLDPASLRNALDGIDAVIHLVGIISEFRESTFEHVHFRGTQNLVAAAQHTSNLRRFVHMSALGTRPNARSRYHQSKWAAEETVRSSGLDFTIFRPSLIYGPQDQFVNLFATIIHRSPIVPVIGNPRARFQPVSVESVATAFVSSLTEPRAAGQTYDLVGPEALTLPQMIDAILDVLHRKRLRIHIPAAVAWAQAAALEFFFPRLLDKPPPLNRDQLLMLQEDNVGNSAAANSLFKLPTPAFQEGIRKYLA